MDSKVNSAETRRNITGLIFSFLDLSFDGVTVGIRINCLKTKFGCIYLMISRHKKLLKRFRLTDSNWTRVIPMGMVISFNYIGCLLNNNLKAALENIREQYLQDHDYTLSLVPNQIKTLGKHFRKIFRRKYGNQIHHSICIRLVQQFKSLLSSNLVTRYR